VKYHHGALPAALRKGALRLIDEDGLSGFSLSKAAKLAGVTSGAPYQHYRDGQALLTDVAAHGYRDLLAELDGIVGDDPVERLGKLAAAQTRYFREHRATYAVMCHCGLGPGADAELAVVAERVIDVIREAATRVAAPDAVDDLTLQTVATAQGFALLSTDSSLGRGASSARMADLACQAVTTLASSARWIAS
jgi:AcrR family transcriptional regulator